MVRPTLAKQLAEKERHDDIAKLSNEELFDLFMPHTFWQHIDFWICYHLPWFHKWFWKVICWFYPWDIDTKTRHWRWENPRED